MVEAGQRHQPLHRFLFARGALREGGRQAAVGGEQQPPEVRAPGPAVVGLDHHRGEIRHRNRAHLAVGVRYRDAIIATHHRPPALRIQPDRSVRRTTEQAAQAGPDGHANLTAAIEARRRTASKALLACLARFWQLLAVARLVLLYALALA